MARPFFVRKSSIPEPTKGDESQTKGMIALIPSDEYLDKLIIEGGDPKEQLHMTLLMIGEVSEWSKSAKDGLLNTIDSKFPKSVVEANILGHAEFNPDEKQCSVYLVSNIAEDIISFKDDLLRDDEFPEQHTPWTAHITAGYNLDPNKLSYTGPVTFDKVRVAFGEEVYDFPLKAVKEAKLAFFVRQASLNEPFFVRKATFAKNSVKWEDYSAQHPEEKLTLEHTPSKGYSISGGEYRAEVKATINGTPAGHLRYQPKGDYEYYPGEITGLTTYDPHKGKGIGRAMIEHAIQQSGAPVYHSDDKTDAGNDFAAATPEYNPPPGYAEKYRQSQAFFVRKGTLQYDMPSTKDQAQFNNPNFQPRMLDDAEVLSGNKYQLTHRYNRNLLYPGYAKHDPEFFENMDHTIHNSPLPAAMTLHRGMNITPDNPFSDTIKNIVPGTTLSNAGFQSASSDPNVASEYSKKGAGALGGGGESHVFHINAPAGFPAYQMRYTGPGAQQWAAHKEYVLPRNTNLTINDHTVDAQGTHHYNVTPSLSKEPIKQPTYRTYKTAWFVRTAEGYGTGYKWSTDDNGLSTLHHESGAYATMQDHRDGTIHGTVYDKDGNVVHTQQYPDDKPVSASSQLKKTLNVHVNSVAPPEHHWEDALMKGSNPWPNGYVHPSEKNEGFTPNGGDPDSWLEDDGSPGKKWHDDGEYGSSYKHPNGNVGLASPNKDGSFTGSVLHPAYDDDVSVGKYPTEHEAQSHVNDIIHHKDFHDLVNAGYAKTHPSDNPYAMPPGDPQNSIEGKGWQPMANAHGGISGYNFEHVNGNVGTVKPTLKGGVQALISHPQGDAVTLGKYPNKDIAMGHINDIIHNDEPTDLINAAGKKYQNSLVAQPTAPGWINDPNGYESSYKHPNGNTGSTYKDVDGQYYAAVQHPGLKNTALDLGAYGSLQEAQKHINDIIGKTNPNDLGNAALQKMKDSIQAKQNPGPKWVSGKNGGSIFQHGNGNIGAITPKANGQYQASIDHPREGKLLVGNYSSAKEAQGHINDIIHEKDGYKLGQAATQKLNESKGIKTPALSTDADSEDGKGWKPDPGVGQHFYHNNGNLGDVSPDENSGKYHATIVGQQSDYNMGLHNSLEEAKAAIMQHIHKTNAGDLYSAEQSFKHPEQIRQPKQKTPIDPNFASDDEISNRTMGGPGSKTRTIQDYNAWQRKPDKGDGDTGGLDHDFYRRFDNTIRQHKLTQPMTVYRGMSIKPDTSIGRTLADVNNPNRQIKIDGFQSTSTNRGTATDFGSGHIFHINAPAGFPLYQMPYHGANHGQSSEEEWTLPRGTSFQIHKSYPDPNNGKRMVHEVTPIEGEPRPRKKWVAPTLNHDENWSDIPGTSTGGQQYKFPHGLNNGYASPQGLVGPVPANPNLDPGENFMSISGHGDMNYHPTLEDAKQHVNKKMEQWLKSHTSKKLAFFVRSGNKTIVTPHKSPLIAFYVRSSRRKMKHYFVRTAGDVIPLPQKNIPSMDQDDDEYDASYPGVSKFDRELAKGNIDSSKEFGLNPHSNYRAPGEF